MGYDAQAFWIRESGVGEIRTLPLPAPRDGEVLIRTLNTGISRGTESLVFGGLVPASQYEAMRAPFQEGDFSFPLKYGYLNVGVVDDGPAHLRGRRAFCLYPHQTAYVVDSSAITVLPDDVPSDRAVLTGTVETAINAVWDARPVLGDTVTVVGAGMVGCAVARVVSGIPGVRVELVDIDPSRSALADALGVGFATPTNAREGRDLVFHASATAPGLQLSLDLLTNEGTVIDLSWYGDREVQLALGAAFHSRRLTVRASQVGQLAPVVVGRRTFADRLALAVELLRDDSFDALLTGRSAFADLPRTMARISAGDLQAVCHVVDFPQEQPCSV